MLQKKRNRLDCISHKQLEGGLDFLKIYDGGSIYSDLIKNMTGTYRNTKVSISRNQMFVVFETTSMAARKGFKASIHKIGKVIRKQFM